jgi:hypothetical protein
VLDIPRDRHGRLDPMLIGKYQCRFPGFDDKIIALYARGVSTRDIQAHVGELYGVDIFPTVTDSVIEQVHSWKTGRWPPASAWLSCLFICSFSPRCLQPAHWQCNFHHNYASKSFRQCCEATRRM